MARTPRRTCPRPSGPGGEVVVYEALDGEVRVEVLLERETVWLTQMQMAELFGRERRVGTLTTTHRIE